MYDSKTKFNPVCISDIFPELHVVSFIIRREVFFIKMNVIPGFSMNQKALKCNTETNVEKGSKLMN